MDDALEIERLAGQMFQEVLRRAHLMSAPELAAVVAEEARTIGAQPLVLYLLDREQKLLVPVPGHGAGEREAIPVQVDVITSAKTPVTTTGTAGTLIEVGRFLLEARAASRRAAATRAPAPAHTRPRPTSPEHTA